MKRLLLVATIGLAIGCGDDDPPPITGFDTGTDDAAGDVIERDLGPDPDVVEDTVPDGTPDAEEDVVTDAEVDVDPDGESDVIEDTVEDGTDVEPDLDDVGFDVDFDASDFGDTFEGVCGDEFWDPGEDCDGFVFEDCETFGYEGGELGCDETCKYDFSDCEGERPNAAECALDRFSLSEACDGCLLESCSTEITTAVGAAEWPPAAVGGECEEFFLCLAGCDCGDFECEDPCYEGGAWTACEVALNAVSACQTESCVLECTCGNGFTDEGEDCDTGDGGFLFTTCADLGYDDGELGCTAECTYDVAACIGEPGFCGDGTVDWGLDEECDDVLEDTCEDRGYEGGTLLCTECAIDTSSCELTVTREDGTCEAPIAFEEVATEDGAGSFSVVDTTVGAAASHVGSCAGRGRELVFTWTPSASGDYTISTVIGEEADTVLYIRTSCEDTESEVACNDDWSSLDSRVFFTATEGNTYFVFADSFSLDEPAPFTLRIEEGRIDEGGFPDPK